MTSADDNDSAPPGRPPDGLDGCDLSSIRVAVRVRPFLPIESGSARCVEVLPPTEPSDDDSIHGDYGGCSSSPLSRSVCIGYGGDSGATFTFDQVLPPSASQGEVYASCVRPLVRQCLSGYNATVLAYGQTGSGKTHTILGPPSLAAARADDRSADGEGVIPRALRELFDGLEVTRETANLRAAIDDSEMDDAEIDDAAIDVAESKVDGAAPGASGPFEYEVRVQFLELYGEELRDLLDPSPPTGQPRSRIQIRDALKDGGATVEPEVIGATELRVTSAEEALSCLRKGILRRVTGATAMNAESSRSHVIMTVVVEQTTTTVHGAEAHDLDGEDHNMEEVEVKRSKFHFVDLAGSERQKRSLAKGKRLKEGIDINKGLLVLGNVISSLGDPAKRGRSHVPYRDSKLTRLLKGSLGGNHRTLMIACVSPASSDLEESLNCLRYANRARNIQNRAVINVDGTSKLVGELRFQVQALAAELLRLQEDWTSAASAGGDGAAAIPMGRLGSLEEVSDSSELEGPPKTLVPAQVAFPTEQLRSLAEGAHSLVAPVRNRTASLDRVLSPRQPRSVGGRGAAEFPRRSNSWGGKLPPAVPAAHFARPASVSRLESMSRTDARVSSPTAAVSPVEAPTPQRTGRTQPRSDGGVVEELARTRRRLEQMERELRESERHRVESEAEARRSREEALELSEQLFVARAEREFWWLKARGGGPTDAAAVLEMQNSGDSTVEDDSKGDDGMEGSTGESDEFCTKQDFVAKVAHYERELAALRKALQTMEGAGDQIENAEHHDSQPGSPESSASTSVPANFEDIPKSDSVDTVDLHLSVGQEPPHQDSLNLAAQGGDERSQLSSVHSSLYDLADHAMLLDGSNGNSSGNHNEKSNLDGVADSMNFSVSVGDTMSDPADADSDKADKGHVTVQDKEVDALARRQQDLDMQLLELSMSINDKEELVKQLHQSQEKYESMRKHYEQKLQLVQAQVRICEEEHEHLILALRKQHADDFHENNNVLREKESIIGNLKKHQHQLSSLAKVSSRGEAIMAKLHHDLMTMKWHKIELQRQMSEERSRHLMEVLQPKMLYAERNSVADISVEHNEAKSVQQKARIHVEKKEEDESKHSSEEAKRQRTQTLKFMVMERAGVDSIMFGQRGVWNQHSLAGSRNQWRKSERARLDTCRDIEKICSHLDAKVAQVVRKDVAAEKLVKEWEDRLRLLSRREELTKKEKHQVQEEVEAIDAQIQHKEGMIRHLTKRLGERNGLSKNSTVLEDEFSKSLCAGASPLSVAQLVSEILFGMVVVERRHVASLSQTEAFLNQKTMDALNMAKLKDAALLSHMEEERQARATLAQSQKEQIFSLMAMVREMGRQNKGTPDMKPSPDSMMLLLSNQRTAVLEREIMELKERNQLMQAYKAEEANGATDLKQTTCGCRELQSELKRFKSLLQDIQTILANECRSTGSHDGSKHDSKNVTGETKWIARMNQMVQEALYRGPKIDDSDNSCPSFNLSGINDHLLLSLDIIESEDEEEGLEWSGDIIEDLSHMAEGRMPSHLVEDKSMEKTLPVSSRAALDETTLGIHNPSALNFILKLGRDISLRFDQEGRSRRTKDVHTEDEPQRPWWHVLNLGSLCCGRRDK